MKKALILFFCLPNLVFGQEGGLWSTNSVDYGSNLHYYEQYMPTSTCGEIIHYSNYSVSFCEKYRLSEWAIYYITDEDVSGLGYSIKGFYFLRDPNLKGRDADQAAFYKNVYDKGHLVPAQDMNYDLQKMGETYFFTNVSPQHKDLNRGGWKILEKQIREWTRKFGEVAVISGWVTKDIKSFIYGPSEIFTKEEYIFDSKYIPVPNYFYKVYIDVKNSRSIAFLFPNEALTKPLLEYVVSIDYLESVTGLDFFYKLSDEDELSFEIDTGNKK
jgi:endonuclease G, mitochondrial